MKILEQIFKGKNDWLVNMLMERNKQQAKQIENLKQRIRYMDTKCMLLEEHERKS